MPFTHWLSPQTAPRKVSHPPHLALCSPVSLEHPGPDLCPKRWALLRIWHPGALCVVCSLEAVFAPILAGKGEISWVAPNDQNSRLWAGLGRQIMLQCQFLHWGLGELAGEIQQKKFGEREVSCHSSPAAAFPER